MDNTLQKLESLLPERPFVLVLRLNDGSRVEAGKRRAAEVRRRLR